MASVFALLLVAYRIQRNLLRIYQHKAGLTFTFYKVLIIAGLFHSTTAISRDGI